MKSFLKLELSEWLFLLFGIVLQIVVYAIAGGGWLSFVSGLFGICSVVLCSQRKMSSFFFGFVQVITYTILVMQQKLYAEALVNVFYFVTMIIGLISWLSNYNSEESEVEARALSAKGWIISAMAFVLCTIGSYFILRATNDTQPFMDAVSAIPAFIAQILMITRYREQWAYWLVVNITTLIVWINVKDWCMIALYIFWIINCFYGYVKWSK